MCSSDLEITRQCFPILLDIDHPSFHRNLERLSYCAQRADEAKAQGGVVGMLGKAAWSVAGAAVFARMFFIPVKSNALPEKTLMRPAW